MSKQTGASTVGVTLAVQFPSISTSLTKLSTKHIADHWGYKMPTVSHRTKRCFLAFGAALAATSVAQAEPALPAYNAVIAETSISGISSGAYMAVQLGVAWSSVVKGVGAIAGGPFGCSGGSGSAALSTCMGGAPAPDLQDMIQRTNDWSRSGAIDDTGGIARQKIYLFHGYNDKVVFGPVSDTLHDFYAHYLGASRGNMFYQDAIGAGHAQVTLAYGGQCNANGGEYINACEYDQAGIILQHIYGALQPRNDGTLSGQLLTFSQADFTAPDRPIDDSMDDKGFVYVPSACSAKEPCRLHIALHGCKQAFANIGEDFVRHAGYNEWADSNHIIVLYPQTHAVIGATILSVNNPEACWDWWGYLDANPTVSPTYLLKSGKQIRAIKGMIDQVTSGVAGSTLPAPAAPAATRVADRSSAAADVVWSAAAGATGYELYRAGPGGDFSRIATVPDLSYGDGGLKAATQYRYEVRPLVTGGVGPFSAIVSATTLRKAPRCDDPGSCPMH